LAEERAGIGRSTFYDIRRDLYTAGLASHASKLYRVSPSGERWLTEPVEGSDNGAGP
jgi:hypothetical protein